MPHELSMSGDGILRASLSGEIDRTVIDAFKKELDPFLEAATTDAPAAIIIDAHQAGTLSSYARRTLTSLNEDPRLGKVALLSTSRRFKVFAGFVQKTTSRNNIKLFAQEQPAAQWIKTND